MEGLELLIVVGLHPEEPGEDPSLVGQIVSDPLAVVIRPAPLSADAATVLLRETLSPEADEAFCAACWEETAGNPLLLRELVHAIVAEGLAPTEANVPLLPELGARAGSRAVSIRLSRLPPEAAMVAQAVAILGDDAEPRQAAALADLDEQAAFEAVDALARVDVLRPQPPLAFVHPLIRAAVYETLTPLERDSGHARAARLSPTPGRSGTRRRAPAALSPERGCTGRRDAARGCPPRRKPRCFGERRRLPSPRARGAAAGRGARRSAPRARRGRGARERRGRNRAPARGACAGREPCAARRGRATARRPAVRPPRRGGGRRAQEALDELAGADPELERFLAAGLITNGLFAPGLHRDAAQRLERVRVEPRAGTAGEKLLLSLLAYHDARAGRPAAEVVPLARKALDDGTILRADQPAVPYPVGAGLVPTSTVLAMADLDEVLTVYEDALAEAHRHGSTLAFGAVKVFRAFALRWRGDLGEVEAEAREALAAGEVWGATARFARHAAAFLADSLMEQGRLDEAAAVLAGLARRSSSRQHAPALPRRQRQAPAPAARRPGRGPRGDARGRTPVRGGRQPEPRLHRVALSRRAGSASAWPAGRGRPACRGRVELARTWGAPRALGAALRAAGLVEGGERGLELLVEAVDVLSGSPARLEHAKAGPTWAPRFAGPIAAPMPASSFGTRSSWRRSAAPRPWPHGPRASFSPPVRVHGASP